MQQVAVFVDAGYLFAASSALLTGSKQPRTDIKLNAEQAIKELFEAAAKAAPDVRLLRIYWYDGIKPFQGPSPSQTSLSQQPNVKLRLGFINSFGQQKGVDSLIVTDLIDLARNAAISDALIVAGDEDLRVGVQVAQTYGVRVHLLGVEPSRGTQSPHLLQEVDSHIEWSRSIVETVISCTKSVVKGPLRPILDQLGPQVGTNVDFSAVIGTVMVRFDTEQITSIKAHLESTGSLPRDVDAPLLAQARHTLGADLNTEQKRQLRREAQAFVRDRSK
ncbi:MAG: NYN domain-containing protein [Sphingorhabdus sp.]|jgi:hypothetical protein|uniref:NYN domain-containing protein n=1 Tax=Sphingorhabdus sp. TaxID=1902408 RepID=UPI0025F2DC21|nr:NYN domain-containing protein [Sphingorhabdus sp.]MCO4090930.1 NYN domain-containing protein [Sphingorhabdus sp.]